MFINFYGFLNWWKAGLLIKNDIAKYCPCTRVLAQETRSWFPRALILKWLDQIPIFKIFIFICLINSLLRAFPVKSNKINFNMHAMEFLVGFQSIGWQTWSILLINHVCWKEKKSMHLFMLLVMSRVATIHQTLINHFTTYSCQSICSTNSYTLTIHTAVVFSWCARITIKSEMIMQ